MAEQKMSATMFLKNVKKIYSCTVSNFRNFRIFRSISSDRINHIRTFHNKRSEKNDEDY